MCVSPDLQAACDTDPMPKPFFEHNFLSFVEQG